MSTLSEASKLLKGSEGESKFNVKAFASVVLGGILVWFMGNVLWTGGSNLPTVGADPSVLAASTPTQVVLSTEAEASSAVSPAASQVLEYPTPIILEREVVVTVEVPGPVQYVEVPGPVVEVTRIVEVPALVDPLLLLPTATPRPGLAPGTIEICARVSGAQAVYIGGLGVVDGGCQIFTFAIGQTEIKVQVNK